MTLADEAEVHAKVAVLEDRVTDMQQDIRDIYMMLQGAPNSIRTRLHKMEADRAAANAATAAVEAVKLVYAQAAERRFTRGEKLAGLAFGLGLLACSIASLIFAVSQRA